MSIAHIIKRCTNVLFIIFTLFTFSDSLLFPTPRLTLPQTMHPVGGEGRVSLRQAPRLVLHIYDGGYVM